MATLPPSNLKIVITSIGHLKSETKNFIEDFLFFVPYSKYFQRTHSHTFDDIVTAAKKHDVTDLFIVCQRYRKLRYLLHLKLPNGSASLYRILNFQPVKSLDKPAVSDAVNSEVFFEGFETDLGEKVESSLSSVFSRAENLAARQVITVKNNDDFIFFRKYKYVFLSNSDVRLQECGPRFTLKLRTFREVLGDKDEEKIKYIYNEFGMNREERKNYFKRTYL